MSAGFTKGPWGIEMVRERLWVGPRNADGEVLDNVCCFNVDTKFAPAFLARQGANARLVANAPHMFDVLEVIAAEPAEMTNWSDEQIRGWAYAVAGNAQAAIAKARGLA